MIIHRVFIIEIDDDGRLAVGILLRGSIRNSGTSHGPHLTLVCIELGSIIGISLEILHSGHAKRVLVDPSVKGRWEGDPERLQTCNLLDLSGVDILR